jgi:hypothetical protein
MARPNSHIITASLIGFGAIAWAFAGFSLVKTREIVAPLNFMGINRSPYGEILAMAMQGPIDTNFNAVNLFGGNQYAAWLNQKEKLGKNLPQFPKFSASPYEFADNYINFLAKVPQISTNPRLPGAAHKLYLRRQAEDKLRFAYQLDPSHYGNYAVLHFFLVEGLTTRPELSKTASQLADDTIQYCLHKEEDPRPALTGCAASIHMIHLMFEDRGRNPKGPYKFTTEEMRKYLGTLDVCIARYRKIEAEWNANHYWQRLSPQRVAECQERIDFSCNLRNAAETGIIRLEKEKTSNGLPPLIAR